MHNEISGVANEAMRKCLTSAKKQEYETRKSRNIGRKDIVSKRVESTGVASQCNDYIGNPIAHDIQQKKSDERGAASFYNLARVGVGEDQIRPETDHEHGWSKNAQIQKHLPPLADFTLEEITVKHFVEMRRGKTERGGARKIEAAVVILSALS